MHHLSPTSAVRQYAAALEQGDWNAIAAHPGLHETLQHFPAMRAAFPDLHHTFEHEVVAGETVCTIVFAHGTHLGTFLGIPPTGRPVRFMVMGLDRIIDGVVVEHWALPDWMSLLQQIGAVIRPAPAGA